MGLSRWICNRFGHRWMGVTPREHICIEDVCWRCWDHKTVHLYGEWSHTCGEKYGEKNHGS